MNPRSLARRCLCVATLTCASVSPLLAQHAPVADKPWPRVAFQEICDTTTSLPDMGATRGESGDCITFIANGGDGSGRLFLVERAGRIAILKDGKLLKAPFLDIAPLTTMRGERGLFSVAFPPNFKTSGNFYINYTDTAGNVTLARYQVDPQHPDQAIAASGQILLSIPHNKYSNHNGGQLAFGPDGFLYFSIGDGGSGYDPDNHGQDLGSYLGKLLRLDVQGPPDSGKLYRIPPTNPFVGNPKAKPEIWALGLRNPWRIAFDSANGDLYIGNVGQNKYEQIYYAPASSKGGENYGWSIYEGNHDTLDKKQPQPQGTPGPVTFPVAEFSHSPDLFTSITGGYIYRAAEYPEWKGIYFFTDWGNSQFWALRREADGQWHTHRVDDAKTPTPPHPATFGLDEQGNLYTAGFSDGKIYRLTERPEDN